MLQSKMDECSFDFEMLVSNDEDLINDLPYEILELVFCFAGQRSNIPIKMTCKYWRSLHKTRITAGEFLIELAEVADRHMLEWAVTAEFDVRIPEVMNVAVHVGDLPFMDWLLSIGVPINDDVYEYYAMNNSEIAGWVKHNIRHGHFSRLSNVVRDNMVIGNGDAIARLYADGKYAFDDGDVGVAARAGDLSLAKWLVDVNLVTGHDCFIEASYAGNFELMKWLVDKGAVHRDHYTDGKIIKCMAKPFASFSSLQVACFSAKDEYNTKHVEWFFKSVAHKPSDINLKHAIESLDLLKAFHHAGCQLRSDLYACAVRKHKLDVINYLHECGCPLPHDMTELSAAVSYCYDKDIRQWAIDKKIPVSPQHHRYKYINVREYFGWDVPVYTPTYVEHRQATIPRASEAFPSIAFPGVGFPGMLFNS